jgi:hypothetical protein
MKKLPTTVGIRGELCWYYSEADAFVNTKRNTNYIYFHIDFADSL